MLSIPGWDPTADATEPAAVVTVDGVVLGVDDVEVSRELATSLPGTVLGGAGLTAATGSATWAQPEDATDRVSTPWAPRGSIPPRSGARALVDLGDERGTCRVFTGRVDSAEGSLVDGEASSALVDDIDRLNRPITLAPLMNAMPPLTEGGLARYIGMSGIWVADRVLRSCGFYATPLAPSGTVVSATMMGSAWPELGELTACTAPTGGAFPSFPAAPWGLCAQDIDVTYAPSTARTLNAPMEVMWQIPGFDAGSGNFVQIAFGSATLRLVLTTTQIAVQEPSGTTDLVGVRTAATTLIVVRFTPSGSNLGIELRTNDGAVASTTITPAAPLFTTPMSSVRVYADGTDRTGAVKVGFPSTSFTDLTRTPTALFSVGAVTPHAITVQPSIIRRPALELLKEHAEAVAAALWLDEQGRVRWVARDVLTTGPVARTLTSAHDLLDAAWSDEWRDVYAGVEVSWADVTVTRAARDTVTLWEGGGSVDSGDVVSEIIHPTAGEDWIMVDTSITKAGPSTTLETFNYGIGSFTGATLTDTGSSSEAWAPTSLVDTSLRRIDWQTYVVESTVGTVPSGQRAEMQGPSSFAAGIWSARWGQALPVLRGRGKFQIATSTATSSTTGPDGAAVYSHDGGWWVQSATQALALADWIAATATVRTPQLGQVEVNYDPRLQLGDKVVIEDRDRSGLRVTGILFALKHQVKGADASTSVSVRVLSVERLDVTLAEYDLVWAGATLAARDAQWAGQTLAAFDNNPLARS